MLGRLNVSMMVMLGAVNAALAQTTSPTTPASPAPATDGGGATWLWIIIGLAIIAGLVWYFMRGRPRATTVGTTGTSTTSSGVPTGRPNVYDNEKRK